MSISDEITAIGNEVYRKAIDLIIEHSRKVREALQLMVNATHLFSSSKNIELKENYNRISTIEEEADVIKRELIEQLTRSAPAFLYREDFFRFVTESDELIEIAQSFTRQLVRISDSKFATLSLDHFEPILTEILEEYDRLREAVMMLPFNPKRVLDLVIAVHNIESKIDGLYHDIEFKLFVEVEDIRKLMLYRDLLNLLEDLSDMIEDASDDLRVLALHRIA
ncbi:MAG: DUF47 family protein [Candidatus Methanomethyliaceae archaeon]|nr:DUF47 family protein [Candidatus Methanomethyliaceae archaeon]MDW7970868.1 DUF47 family protein [Nitrososphaerota archaeon]